MLQSHKMKKQIFYRHALFMLILSFFMGCSPRQESVLQFGMVQWIGYSPIYIAEANSLLPDTLRIIDYPSNYDILEALKANELQAACLTLDEALRLNTEGVQLYVILVLDTSHGADALLASQSITSMQDLRGKHIAYEPQSVQEYLLFRALQENNMSMSDITPVLLKFDMQLRGWESKRYDAVATFEPNKQKLLASGMHTLFDSSEIPNEIIDVVVVSEKALRENKKTLQTFVNAYFMALKNIQEDLSTHTTIASYLQTTPLNVAEAFSGIKLIDQATNLSMLAGENPKILQNKLKIMNYLKQEPSASATAAINLYPHLLHVDSK